MPLLLHSYRFRGIEVRKKLKMISGIGMERVNHAVQHKNHVPKVMIVCTTGIVVDGDISLGGTAVKVGFDRVGRMEAAQKDSYKAVWTAEGQRRHPKVPSNKLRSKGKKYFKGMEVTGSNEGTTENPKWSLKVYFKEIMLPRLDELALQHSCIIRWQWDGAGPHKEGGLVEYLQEEFDKRGWMLACQCSQTPPVNIQDACVFPSLSKSQSKAQAMASGKRCLREEEIWEASKAAFDRMPLSTIARSYAGHMQVVAAMIACDGSNDFMNEKGHGHYNIRKAYVETDDGEGVCVLTDEAAVDIGSELLKYETMCKEDADYSQMREDELAVILSAGTRRKQLRKCFRALKQYKK